MEGPKSRGPPVIQSRPWGLEGVWEKMCGEKQRGFGSILKVEPKDLLLD